MRVKVDMNLIVRLWKKQAVTIHRLRSFVGLVVMVQKAASVHRTSIQFFAVEFDDIAVGVEDVDLGVARGGVGTKLHLSEVVVGKIVAETFAVEPR